MSGHTLKPTASSHPIEARAELHQAGEPKGRGAGPSRNLGAPAADPRTFSRERFDEERASALARLRSLLWLRLLQRATLDDLVMEHTLRNVSNLGAFLRREGRQHLASSDRHRRWYGRWAVKLAAELLRFAQSMHRVRADG